MHKCTSCLDGGAVLIISDAAGWFQVMYLMHFVSLLPYPHVSHLLFTGLIFYDSGHQFQASLSENRLIFYLYIRYKYATNSIP